MNIRNFANGTRVSRLGRAGRIVLALAFLQSMTLSPALWAGAFIFAGESNGVDLILHPTGYTGSGGNLNVGVCIDPNSLNAQDLVIPIKNNISVWNDLQPIANNVQTGVVSGIDAESVLLHEMGHCIGLAHVNAASESGLSGSNMDFTKATDGANNVLEINAGADGVIGSHDDIRGDDVNLHWFNPANDPFQLPIHTPVETSQYKRDAASLPAGDSFAQNASRQLSQAMGYPYSEAVMQQGTYSGETQREIVSDGASTILLAASGVDETAGTGDDYQIVLTYEGITTGSNCDITVIMEAMSGLAYCSVGGLLIGTDHVRITGASIHLGAGYTYHFNTELRDGGGNQPPVAVNDSASVNEDGSVDIAVLGNDSDPDDDPLDVTGVSNPPHGTSSVNPNDTIHYQPDGNYNGADSFSYTLSDGNGGSDTGNVSMTVNPRNDFPVAVDDSGVTTGSETPVDIYVLDNDSDVDSDPLSVSGVTDGAFGTVTNNTTYVTYLPNAGHLGSDSFSYTLSDGKGGTDTADVSVTTETDTGGPDYAVADFSTEEGTLSGSYQDTWAADGNTQSITEIQSGSRPRRASDSLEHIWQFDLAAGNNTFNVVAQGNFPDGDQDDAFQFQWSTSSSGGWANMVTVPGAGNTYVIAGGVSGTIYVRVIDNDGTRRNTVLSTIEIDQMYFDATTPGPGLLVDSIVLSTIDAQRRRKHGHAVVTVVDDLGNLISGATVSGTFSGGFNESVSGDTSGGSVIFTTSATRRGSVSFTFCVDDITGTLPYNGGQVCESF